MVTKKLQRRNAEQDRYRLNSIAKMKVTVNNKLCFAKWPKSDVPVNFLKIL